MSRDPEVRDGTAPTGGSEPIRIVISDEHEMVRAGLCLLLAREPDLTVTFDVPDAAAAAGVLAAHHVDVLVFDVGLPGSASLAVVPALRESHPGTAIVAVALQSDPKLAREALGLGVSAFVVKSAPAQELIGAIRLAAAGRTS
ncbi:MAG: response regulator transcription factor, partial [Actinomycetota bacterium]|nr:response regulator transcription factor [Actinomycetota bacterium]